VNKKTVLVPGSSKSKSERNERHSKPTMSVYLQSLRTEKFVQGPKKWTDTPEQAREFGGGIDALFFCYQNHLADMQILGRFTDPQKDFTIPLKESSFE
jgi:hypothetical protein